ncbi:quinone-dependent dihydroorotate dehydrogenase [Rhodovulum sp. 12E13]|uniref:quinone-dependent dihydroorotate dehydrogenase n=1 Tax=Rhodovulum sp. 12E13 TaxID=2203891 RepID=UPI000E169155|nr:quinone-dependent dihydroorotate dehydrogenase [Rhodovulum sp. 12E13]RDC73693.1 quinone-dependent dihydroorotate dehydrogenase [Rhodovulum sp. 12E13]
MSLVEWAGLAALRLVDPETAHALALRGLRAGLVPLPGPVTSDRLATDLAGLALPNPIGLAAGFDKNAEALAPLSSAGFGFIEAGAVTPRAQEGNPRPRLWRLPADRGAINRFGFNNQGMEAVASRLERCPKGAVVGLNLGANKDSADRAADYATVLARLGPMVDFATVNVSSPNTEALRDLQGTAALQELLSGVMAARAALPRPIPVFVKIAPDLSDAEIAAIAETALEAGVQGVVATNTTLSRDGLRSPWKRQKGGLSGAPLMARSTEVLRRLQAETGGTLPLIGVGGIFTAEDALAKIEAGATAVQLYTALAYEGIGLAARLARDLDRLLAARGYSSVIEARGAAG